MIQEVSYCGIDQAFFCRHDLGSELVLGVTRSLKVLVILVGACQWMEMEPSVSGGAEQSGFYLVGIYLVNGLMSFRGVCRKFWMDLWVLSLWYFTQDI